MESDEFDGEQGLGLQSPGTSSSPQTQATRPTRPLKGSMFGRAPSLPIGLPSVAESNHIVTETKVVEEEDWSLTMSSKADEQQFEIMEL